jgi:hypothetical protein
MNSKNETEETATFISHNKADKEVAREIALFLIAEGINVWFDEWVISPGDSIIQEINTGLHSCTHFIILWSKNASTSNWVKRELQSTLAHAINAKSPLIIPIVLDETPLPPLLSDILYINYEGDMEEDQRKIVKAVTGRLPSDNFTRALIKMYHIVIKNSEITACPKCSGLSIDLRSESVESHGWNIEIEKYYCRDCWHVW